MNHIIISRVTKAAVWALFVFGSSLAQGASSFYYWSVTPQGPFIGLTNTPSRLTNAVSIAGGFGHFVALTAEGKVVAWGENSLGQTTVPSNLSNVIAVSAGQYHSAAVTHAGQLVLWGRTSAPQTDYPPSTLDSVTAVACGQHHTVVLKADGTVGAWGPWYMGLTNFTAGLSNIVGIGAGDDHTLAIRADGTVVHWSSYPFPVPSEVTNIIAVAGGNNHALGLRADGSVVAWGCCNTYGVLDVPVAATNVVAMVARSYANAVLRADGTAISPFPFWNASIVSSRYLAGSEKPIVFPFCMINVFTPTTAPSVLISGPPELPGFKAASC